MNKGEYESYQKSVRYFLTAEGLDDLHQVSGECPDCGVDYGESPEGGFSWSPCDCCGSTLGGTRYHAVGLNRKLGQVFCYDICVDCLYYLAYGQLDDQTMMDIEDSE